MLADVLQLTLTYMFTLLSITLSVSALFANLGVNCISFCKLRTLRYRNSKNFEPRDPPSEDLEFLRFGSAHNDRYLSFLGTMEIPCLFFFIFFIIFFFFLANRILQIIHACCMRNGTAISMKLLTVVSLYSVNMFSLLSLFFFFFFRFLITVTLSVVCNRLVVLLAIRNAAR